MDGYQQDWLVRWEREPGKVVSPGWEFPGRGCHLLPQRRRPVVGELSIRQKDL